MSGSVEQRDAPWRRSQSNRSPPPTRDDVDGASLVSSRIRPLFARLSYQGKRSTPASVLTFGRSTSQRLCTRVKQGSVESTRIALQLKRTDAPDSSHVTGRHTCSAEHGRCEEQVGELECFLFTASYRTRNYWSPPASLYEV